MRYHKTLTKNYDLNENDVDNLLLIKPMISKYKDEFIEDFMEKMATYPVNEKQMAAMEANSAKLIQWFDSLFEGNADNAYFSFVGKLGLSLNKYKFEPEFISSMISFVRLWMHEKIFSLIDDDIHRKGILLSMHKMLDINSEIIISSYYEKLVSTYNPVHSYRNRVVDLSEKFSFIVHALMVITLIGLTLTAGIAFVIETVHLFGEQPDHALINALGSLLIIWVLVELLHTEIQMLKGGKFKNSIFISVALIAFIRDLMIITLKHETTNMLQHGFILAAIAVLGIVYWLIVRTENNN
ncbi:MAG: phosphate-starvation-inducible PsiE family protein [Deferribacterales bacterium]